MHAVRNSVVIAVVMVLAGVAIVAIAGVRAESPASSLSFVSARVENRLGRLEERLDTLTARAQDARTLSASAQAEALHESGHSRTLVSDHVESRLSALETGFAALVIRIDAIEDKLKSVEDFRDRPAVWPELLALGRELTADRMAAIASIRHTPIGQVFKKYGYPSRTGTESGMWRFVYQMTGEPTSPCVAFYALDGLVDDVRISNF